MPFAPLRPRCAARLAWPSTCAVCRGWAWSRLCEPCLAAWAPPRVRCATCALALPAAGTPCAHCRAHPAGTDRVVAALDYDHPWDRVIARFKFHDGVDLADALADRLAAAVRRAHAPGPSLGEADTRAGAGAAAWVGKPADHRPHRLPIALPDLVLPVPLGPLRLRERGYNQAWELARRVARRLGLQASPLALLRVLETPAQAALSRAERRVNLRHAFAVDPRHARELAGRRVALVDDVMTTGATFNELARVLRAAGAARVDAWALARTPAPD